MPITPQPRTKVGQDYGGYGKLLFAYDGNDVARYYANGASISTAYDLSGNGLTLTSTGTNRPVMSINTDGLGNSSMYFTRSSSQHLLSSSSYNYSGSITYVIVGSKATINDGMFIGSQSSLNSFEFGTASSNKFQAYDSGSALTTASTYPLDTRYIFVVVSNGANSVVYLNGTSVASGTLGTGGLVSGFALGSWRSAFNFLDGNTYVVMAYAGVMPAGNISAVTRALSARFQLSVTP